MEIRDVSYEQYTSTIENSLDLLSLDKQGVTSKRDSLKQGIKEDGR